MMRKIIWGMVALMALALLVGCGGEEQPFPSAKPYTATLYYLNEKHHIVPVEMETDVLITPELALSYISGEAGRETAHSFGLLPPVDGDTEAALELAGTGASVTLVNFNPVNKQHEQSVIGCVSNTLISAGAKEVLIQTQEEMAGLPFGTDISKPFTDMIYISDAEALKLASPLIMYYIDQDVKCLVPVISYLTAKPTLEAVMKHYIEGPFEEHDLTTGLPLGVELIGASVQGEKAMLNFSQGFENIMENADIEALTLQAIEKTCNNIDGVKAVQIFVEGKEYKSINVTL